MLPHFKDNTGNHFLKRLTRVKLRQDTLPVMNCLEELPQPETCLTQFTLNGIFGQQEFPLDIPNPASATVADLAQVVYTKTGIVPHRQRLVFKGIIFDPPDTDIWAPLLEDLNFRSGDKVEISRSARPLGEQDAVEELERINDVVHKFSSDVDDLVSKRDRVQQGYMEGGNQVMALTFLRRDFEYVKEQLQENIQVLNSLNFDHRNAVAEAKRRELVDLCQRQVDNCSDMSAYIFNKLAQAHYLSNVGKIYTHDFRTSPSRNKWTKKKQ
ncbi:hypothetical protein BsWGS_23539 [Bradybaena similaris]